MKYAAIDIGSNTFLLTIIENELNNPPRIIADEVRYVRLQAGINHEGCFSQEALERARNSLEDFTSLMRHHQVDHVLAVATSAARQAKNGEEIKKIAEGLGITLDIISGEREAALTFSGAHFFQKISGYHWVIDIGGGSTEIILGYGEEIKWKYSLPLGCVRLSQQWARDVSGMRDFIRQVFLSTIPDELLAKSATAIAVAGTPVELVRICSAGRFKLENVEGFVFDQKLFTQVVQIVVTLSAEDLVKNYQVPQIRADVLIHGVLILEHFFRYMNLSELRVSRSGIRFGILKELLGVRSL